MNEPQQSQAEHSAMAIAADNLFNKRANPRRHDCEVKNSLLCQEFTERKELVGANTHCAAAVSMLGKMHEKIIYRFPKPRSPNARVRFRAGQNTLQHNELQSIRVSRRVIWQASHPAPT
jgi:hypothetical protein